MFNNNHTLNCLFCTHTCNQSATYISNIGVAPQGYLLPRHDKQVLKFVLMAAKEPLPTLSDEPHHPKTGFASPKRSFRKSKPVLCFAQSHWFSTWLFLHYKQGQDVVFCHTIFSVSCFVSAVPPHSWSSWILVIFAVLSRVTVRHYTCNYLWIFIINWQISHANAHVFKPTGPLRNWWLWPCADDFLSASTLLTLLKCVSWHANLHLAQALTCVH